MAKKLEWAKENVFSANTGGGVTINNNKTYFSADIAINRYKIPDNDGWRLPTRSEFEELINSNSKAWINNNGINGIFINGIFLPACGNRNFYSGTYYYEGQSGDYWTSETLTHNGTDRIGVNYSFGLDHNNNLQDYISTSRYNYGYSIRLVREVEDNCECSPKNFTDEELIEEVKDRGYKVFLEK